MTTTAQSLLSAILARLSSPHLQASLKALLLLLLQSHGKARPQHSPTKSPAALSRFLNRYPWPTRALIRLARAEGEKALDRARRKRGPKPRLLVVLDLVTLAKRGRFPALPLSFFHGAWGLHLVVVYLVYGDLRLPWTYRLWRGKGEKALSLLALRLLASLPPWLPKAFRLLVVADAAFGALRFLAGARAMGPEVIVGMRRDRKTVGGLALSQPRRQGSRVYLRGLRFPVPVSWYRYPLPEGGWEWRYVVATFPATPRTHLVWGRRRGFSFRSWWRGFSCGSSGGLGSGRRVLLGGQGGGGRGWGVQVYAGYTGGASFE